MNNFFYLLAIIVKDVTLSFLVFLYLNVSLMVLKKRLLWKLIAPVKEFEYMCLLI